MRTRVAGYGFSKITKSHRNRFRESLEGEIYLSQLYDRTWGSREALRPTQTTELVRWFQSAPARGCLRLPMPLVLRTCEPTPILGFPAIPRPGDRPRLLGPDLSPRR